MDSYPQAERGSKKTRNHSFFMDKWYLWTNQETSGWNQNIRHKRRSRASCSDWRVIRKAPCIQMQQRRIWNFPAYRRAKRLSLVRIENRLQNRKGSTNVHGAASGRSIADPYQLWRSRPAKTKLERLERRENRKSTATLESRPKCHSRYVYKHIRVPWRAVRQLGKSDWTPVCNERSVWRAAGFSWHHWRGPENNFAERRIRTGLWRTRAGTVWRSSTLRAALYDYQSDKDERRRRACSRMAPCTWSLPDD